MKYDLAKLMHEALKKNKKIFKYSHGDHGSSEHEDHDNEEDVSIEELERIEGKDLAGLIESEIKEVCSKNKSFIKKFEVNNKNFEFVFEIGLFKNMSILFNKNALLNAMKTVNQKIGKKGVEGYLTSFFFDLYFSLDFHPIFLLLLLLQPL